MSFHQELLYNATLRLAQGHKCARAWTRPRVGLLSYGRDYTSGREFSLTLCWCLRPMRNSLKQVRAYRSQRCWQEYAAPGHGRA